MSHGSVEIHQAMDAIRISCAYDSVNPTYIVTVKTGLWIGSAQRYAR